jgi:biopolymer transport protein ExbD
MTPIPSPRSKRHARIEIIPLIDIIFFLLATFVMVSLAMVKNNGIALNLPAVATGTAQPRENLTTISITPDGSLFLDKQPVSLPQLTAALRELRTRGNDPHVALSGDVKSEFGSAMAVLDTLREVGITKISIETQVKSK